MECILIRQSLFVRINYSDELSVVNCNMIGVLGHFASVLVHNCSVSLLPLQKQYHLKETFVS